MNALTPAVSLSSAEESQGRKGDSILGSREQPASSEHLERKGCRGLENLGQLLQASCPDPVGPVLVPLYLLEAQAERMQAFSG